MEGRDAAAAQGNYWFQYAHNGTYGILNRLPKETPSDDRSVGLYLC